MTFWAQMVLVWVGSFCVGFMTPEVQDNNDLAMLGLFITGAMVLGAGMRGFAIIHG